MNKPLFIPLYREYFELFESGVKTTEYRVDGPRWNKKTCYPGRKVTISYGYGKIKRLTAEIDNTYTMQPGPEDFQKIYGSIPTCRVIHLKSISKIDL